MNKPVIKFLLMLGSWIVFLIVLTHGVTYANVPWLKYLWLGLAAYWTGRWMSTGDFS